MFGYIKINKPELKIKDYETYRAFYCTLCDTLSKRYGPTARYFLSYDVTFFAVFSFAVNDAACAFRNGRCRLAPWKKCVKLSKGEDIMMLAADLTILLVWFKLRDDLQDGGPFRKILCLLAVPFLFFKLRKAKRLRPDLYLRTRAYFDLQYRAENDPLTGIDRAADPSAEFFSELAASIVQDERKDACSDLGYYLGRFIYLADAVDDLEKDLKRKNFNPFIKSYGITNKDLPSVPDDVFSVLELTAASAHEAYDKCSVRSFQPIVDNIVKLGLYAQIDELRKKYKEA